MKYRIKIVTFASGRKEYTAQFKGKYWWLNLGYDGKATLEPTFSCEKREYALERIDKHYAGNTKKVLIEFEYINKP